MSAQIETTEPSIRFQPRRLAHANIFVSDVERSLKFYNEVCGLEIVLRQPAISAGFLSNGNTHHDLGMLQVSDTALFGEKGHQILGPGQGAKPGLYHLGWEMESEQALVEAYERAVKANYKIWRTVRHRTSHSIYLYDPDGNIHEFYADVIADWRKLYEQPGGSLSATWVPGAQTPSSDARYHLAPQIRTVDSAPLHPVRMSHAVLVTRNTKRMHEFFEDVVGLSRIANSNDTGHVAFSSPASRYYFAIATVPQVATASPKEKGLHHFSFEMRSAEDIAKSEVALKSLGIPVERSVDTPRKRSIFIRDPDNLLVEFCHRAGDDGANVLSSDVFQI